MPSPSDPGTLNAWHRTHKGYVGDNNMDEAAIPNVDPSHVSWSDATGMHRTNDVPLAAVEASLAAGQPVIANVMHGEHFVLVVGTERRAGGTTLYVNDPGFYRITYDYKADVVGWRLFNMSQAGDASSSSAVIEQVPPAQLLAASPHVLVGRHEWRS